MDHLARPGIWTLLVILSLAVVEVVVVDVYLFRTGGMDATISVEWYRWAEANPIVGVLVGFMVGAVVWGVLGHIFWKHGG